MGLKLRTVQPVACQYIDYNVPASQLQVVQIMLHIMQTSIYNFWIRFLWLQFSTIDPYCTMRKFLNSARIFPDILKL